jgi:CRP-like cAMP-binding protein
MTHKQIPAQWLQIFKTFTRGFADIGPTHWDALTATLSPVEITKEDYFVRPEDREIQLGFIIKGLLRTFFITPSGDEYTTDFCCENDITTNYDLLTPGHPSGYYSQAMEDVILLRIDYPAYERLCRVHLPLETLKTNLITHHYGRKIAREKELLSLTAAEKYQRFVTEYSHITHRIRQYHIASFLGITPVQLSRIKKNSRR